MARTQRGRDSTSPLRQILAVLTTHLSLARRCSHKLDRGVVGMDGELLGDALFIGRDDNLLERTGRGCLGEHRRHGEAVCGIEMFEWLVDPEELGSCGCC